MKKQYTTPEMVIEEMEVMASILESSPGSSPIVLGTPGDEADSPARLDAIDDIELW